MNQRRSDIKNYSIIFEMNLEDEDLKQKIRLLDIFGIGPLMIYAGMKAEELPSWARAGLVLFGGTTILYNGSNYLSISERKKIKT